MVPARKETRNMQNAVLEGNAVFRLPFVIRQPARRLLFCRQPDQGLQRIQRIADVGPFDRLRDPAAALLLEACWRDGRTLP